MWVGILIKLGHNKCTKNKLMPCSNNKKEYDKNRHSMSILET